MKNMRYLKNYNNFINEENIFSDIWKSLVNNIKQAKGKLFIKAMSSILPKSIKLEIDKMVGVKESHILLELFSYSGQMDWQKMSDEEINQFLGYVGKQGSFQSAMERPEKIMSKLDNTNEVVDIMKERGINVPIQIVNKNKPNIQNLYDKINGLNMPKPLKSFLKIASVIVLLGMIVFKASSGVGVSDTHHDISDNSDSHDDQLLAKATELGIDFHMVADKVVTNNDGFFHKLKLWICEFLGIDTEDEKKVTKEEVESGLKTYFSKMIPIYDKASVSNDELSDVSNDCKTTCKLQVMADKNIPQTAKAEIYKYINTTKITFLPEDDFKAIGGKGANGFFVNYSKTETPDGKERNYIFVKFNTEKTVDQMKRTVIHELFHLVDLKTDNKWGISSEDPGVWDFIRIPYSEEDQQKHAADYSDKHKQIFGDKASLGYDQKYLWGDTDNEEGSSFHEVYSMLKVFKNDLVSMGLIKSVTDPVSTDLIEKIMKGEYKDKLSKYSGNWEQLLPLIRQDDSSIKKFSEFLSKVDVKSESPEEDNSDVA